MAVPNWRASSVSGAAAYAPLAEGGFVKTDTWIATIHESLTR
jgi:hypothetical protein